MNYLLPAGASLVHPHLQLLATHVPYSYHDRLMSSAAEYTLRNGTSYFDDLVSREIALNERFIAKDGEWHWLAPFSPLGANEIMAVHDSVSDLGQLMERDLRDLCDGVARVLAFFESLGRLSFNFTLYSARGAETVGGRLVMKLVTRQNLYPNYRNDDYFLQKMLQTELILTPPEELAQKAKAFFNGGGTQ
jgi:galactose-1-phosphate uridylyltransferase